MHTRKLTICLLLSCAAIAPAQAAIEVLPLDDQRWGSAVAADPSQQSPAALRIATIEPAWTGSLPSAPDAFVLSDKLAWTAGNDAVPHAFHNLSPQPLRLELLMVAVGGLSYLSSSATFRLVNARSFGPDWHLNASDAAFPHPGAAGPAPITAFERYARFNIDPNCDCLPVSARGSRAPPATSRT